MEHEENPSCYQVISDYPDYSTDFLESIDWDNLTEAECDCSRKIFRWFPICQEKCSEDVPGISSQILAMSDEQLLEIALPALLYLVVFLVGTVGNAMVIFVVNRFKRMRNVTNVFLASLSTADLCLIWFCVPIMFVKYMSHSWFMGRFACYSVHYIQQFTCFCSVLTMTMISFERYLAIAYPMRNVWLSSIGRAKKVILLIWLCSAFLAIPTAMRIDYQIEKDARGEVVNWCHRRFPAYFANFTSVSQSKLNRIYAVYQLLLLIVFPVLTMSICYARVSIIVYTSSKDRILLSQAIKKRSLRRPTRDGYLPAATLILAVHYVTRVAFSKAATDAVHFSGYSTIPMISTSRQLKSATTQINSYSNSKQKNRVAEANKKQIVQMLISIVVMYTICWLPTIVDEMLTSFGYICRISNSPTLKHMRMGFHALVNSPLKKNFFIKTYCQSCINPILYAFISQNFRATFKSAYSRMKHRLQGVEEIRSRMGSCSSQSMLSTRNHHRIYGSSFNTLTVPGRSLITPNMSRDVSQLSLCRPGSQLSIHRPRSSIAIDGNTTIRPRSPTEISKDSGRPRSPTDVSQCSRKSVTRPRSPTTTSSVSISVPVPRTRTPTGYSESSLKTPNRSRSPTVISNTSNMSRGSIPIEKDHLTVADAVRPRTPPC